MTKAQWLEILENHRDKIEDLMQYFPRLTTGWQILADADSACRQLIIELQEYEVNE